MKVPEKGQRWGIMGGIFDPIHYGHLRLAESAGEEYKLDGILFVVSSAPPHRDHQPIQSFSERVHMTSLGLAESGNFVVSEVEKEIAEPHYTVNLLQNLRSDYPEIDWYLILGADNVAIFDAWHKPDKVADLAQIVAGNRPGFIEQLKQSKWADKIKTFEMPSMEISSTMIRSLLAQKKSIKYLLPEAVRQYIYQKGLYQ